MNKRILLWGLFLALSCVSCASAKLTPEAASKAIARDLDLSEKQVETERITEVGGTATVQASLGLTFVLQKGSDGEWHIYKIRYAGKEWVTPDQFRDALAQYETPDQ